MMVYQSSLAEVVDVLKPEMFYKEAHSLIYEAIVSLYASSSPIDLRTVVVELKKTNNLEHIGGAYYLSSLTNKVVSCGKVIFNASIIIQKALARNFIQFAAEGMNNAYQDTTDIFQLLDSSQLALDKLQSKIIKKSVSSGFVATKKALEEAEKAMNNSKSFSGVNTGSSALNDIFGGWQNSDLIIVAARPGMGKSAMALAFARASLITGVPVGVFLMEMSETQGMNRLFSMEAYHSYGAMIPYSEVKNGLTKEQFKVWNQAAAIYETDSLQVDDTPALTMQALRSRAITMVTRFKVGLLVIDYLQLMVGEKGGTREQEIASIARFLKNLAKELNVPIIALSQLSRGVETRGGDKRPQLSDLRESGEIEQAADVVSFLYRPYYYGIQQDEAGRSTENTCEVVVAKNRNGECATVITKLLISVSALCENYSAQMEQVESPAFTTNSVFFRQPNEFDKDPPF